MSRTIETVLRLTGENEYRNGLKNCASEMKELKSELARVSSDFRTNANSMAALTAKGDVLSRMYDNQSKKVSLLRGALEKAQQSQAEEEKTVAELKEQYSKARQEMDNLKKTVGESSEAYQQAKAEADALGESLVKHQSKLESASGAVSKYTIQLNRAEIDLNNLSDQQAENNRLLEEAKASADGCAASIDKYGDAVRQSADNTKSGASAVDALAGAMVASGIQAKVEDLAATMMDCSHAAQTFEYGVAKVSTIADSSVMSMSDLRSGILQLSTELCVDADDMADALYNALSAGVDTANALEFTAQAAKLSAAGFTDTSTSVDVLTTILNAYSMEASQAEKVASVLVKTQDLGKVTVGDLGKVMGRIVPTASAYGVSLENIATGYAKMTASGINAENTTTYLSTMLAELADSGSKVAAVLQEQTGQSFAELMAEGRSLGDVLAIIGDSCDNDKVAFNNLWSSATAGTAATALFNTGAAAFNSTLRQMERSSGAVDKNYQKMADTSLRASQRMEVASKNLKIAIGEQLNPVLDKLRNGAASLLEGAAKIVSNNPALVAAVTGVVTALGLLATGISALMVAKAAAQAMQTLNIALTANPAGLIAAGIAGLAAAIGTFAASRVDETAEKVKELTEASRALNETVEEGKTTYADSLLSIDATAATAKDYIRILEKLEAQGVKTEDQQEQYAYALEKIQALIPGINIELDEQTGLLKGGVSALQGQVDAWEKAAKAEAAYTWYKADIEAMTKAEYEHNKLLIEKEAIETKIGILKSERAAVESKITANQEKQAALRADASLSAGKRGAEIRKLEEEYQALWHQVEQYGDEINDAEKYHAALIKSLEESSTAIEENREEVAYAEEAYKQYSGQIDKTGSDFAVLYTISEEYDALYVSARDSLTGQMGLLDAYRNDLDVTAAKIVENLRSQQKAYNDYADNLVKALDIGIDMDIVQQLSDGSKQSMMILDKLVNDVRLSVDDLNAAFSDNEKAKDSVAALMATIQQNADMSADKLIPIIRKNMQSLGSAVVDGVIDGIENQMPDYGKSIEKLASVGQETYRRVNLIKSPSRRYRELAKQDVQGLIVQYSEDTPKLQVAAAKLAESGYSAAVQTRKAPPKLPTDSASFPSTVGASGAGQSTTGSAGKTVNLYFTAKTISQSDMDMIVDTVNRELGDNLV